jgi:hypothetical protein
MANKIKIMVYDKEAINLKYGGKIMELFKRTITCVEGEGSCKSLNLFYFI